MSVAPGAAARPSINDVAIHAGVSAQTVSRVANGRDNVRAPTRDRVLASMRALGYRPNSAARNLKSGRFRSIGFVTYGLATFGDTRTLNAVADAAERVGYTTTLLPISDASRTDVAGAFGRLEEQAVDGIVLVTSAEVGAPNEVPVAPGTALVVVGSDVALRFPVVDTDQEQGAMVAMQHLVDLGHRDIAHVAGPVTSFSAKRRAATYTEVMARLEGGTGRLLHGDWSAESGVACGELLVRGGTPPTAIFAANDQMALGVMYAVHRNGLRIPQDVSVVGFDDDVGSAAFWPALTTVHQRLDEVGRVAASTLFALIEGRAGSVAPGDGSREGTIGDPARRIVVDTRLVVRASTGPARTR